jgi:hypothetical protein
MENILDEQKLFHGRVRTEDRLSDYDIGFLSGRAGVECDLTRSDAWLRGWAEANE